MKKTFKYLIFILVLGLILSSCTSPTGDTRKGIGRKDVLYLNLTWHQHQPLYYKDDDGVYTRPWVRAHATKDYYDMAAMIKPYPNVRVTVNITPVLMKQLDDFTENGAKDYYWVLAEKPAVELTEADKTYLLTRFFDANWDNIIYRFPRYKELLNRRGGTTAEEIAKAVSQFTEQDYRDLQIWFNLAWIDPEFLEQSPLKELVDKGEGFSEADKTVLFNEIRNIMAMVIPVHKELQDAGQIPTLRMCASCVYFQPGVHAGPRPHHCRFVDAPLAVHQLRVDCGEHEAASPEVRRATLAALSRPGG